jgi:polysaccharide pyruvyl transferase WcaK-like protein
VIAVIHAYSRVNAGDGLLVDLTLQRLARAGVAAADVTVVAMDAASFADLPRVVKLGTSGRRADRETAGAALSGLGLAAGVLTGGRGPGTATRTLSAADAFVAVGGGYLRAGNRVNRIGTALNHLPPLLVAARSGRPSIYLPQSVGPLTGWVGGRVRRFLSEVDEVHVRDDRSLREVGNAGNVRRTPDLAVLEVARELTASVAPRDVAGPPVVIGRALANATSYPARLHALADRLGGVAWGVQAEGSASKNDRTFYAELGVPADGRVSQLLADNCGPAVSVRLHGALQAIMSGVAAVHLGYERKSWGAYADLGLGNWVHSARGFDPDLVASQVRQLQADPAPFWAAIQAQAQHLQDRSAALDESMARTVARID